MTPTPTTQAQAAAPGSAAPLVSHRLAAFALALLLGLQPVTTDVYLPALPMLARDLAAPMSAAQLTMSDWHLSVRQIMKRNTTVEWAATD